MSVPVRLAAFAVAVAAAFGLGFGIGDVAGPFEEAPAHDVAPGADPHDSRDHGDTEGEQ
jgi:hypothetical protein